MAANYLMVLKLLFINNIRR